MDALNAEREKAQLPPLILDQSLNRTASARAALAASGKAPLAEETPLPRLISGGCYARFALSHGMKGDSVESALDAFIKDPLGVSKVTHAGVTHVGIGVSSVKGDNILLLDLARVVVSLDRDEAVEKLRAEITQRRELNGTIPLEDDDILTTLSQDVASQYMSTQRSSDELIAEAQGEIEAKNFALGRVTIAFQVSNDLDTVVVPERSTDPALSLAGIGVAQGNHPQHEPGSIAVVFFLAEPQEAHSQKRDIPNLPPPKAVPLGKAKSRGTIIEQAWVATLTGNHRKAARMFEKAYQKSKKPSLLYEAARAHARAENTDKALELMTKYAELAEGTDSIKARELISRLETGESIFAESQGAKMSLEAKRFFVLGQRLFDQGEWEGAIDAFQQAYTYAPAPEILYNIGLAHLKAGHIGTALDFFAEFQRMVPEAKSIDEAKQLFMMGVELYRVGQFEAASRRFAMAYSAMPIPDLVYNLALCHKAMGDTDEALRLLREFLDTDPSEEDKAQIREMIKEISQ